MGKRAKIKFYAVAIGRRSGIYQTWPECERQIKGFSGAVYKSFKTHSEADQFISANQGIMIQ